MNIYWICLFVILLSFSWVYTSNRYIENCSNDSYGLSSTQFGVITKDTLLCICIVFSLAMLAATRLYFFDTLSYKLLFEEIQQYSLSECLHNNDFEAGFCLFTKFIGLFTKDYRVYFFAFPIINGIIISKALNLLGYRSLIGLTVYSCTLGLYYNLIVLRQGISLSLLFLAYALWRSNKTLKGILFAVLSFVFHKSALFVIIVFFVSEMIRLKKRGLIIIASASIIIYFVGGTYNILPTILKMILSFLPGSFNKYNYYLYETSFSGISILYLAVYLFNLIFLFISCNDDEDINDIRPIIIGYFVYSIISGSAVSVRIVHFFDMFYAMIFYKQFRGRRIYYLMFCLLHLVFYIRFILVETTLFF